MDRLSVAPISLAPPSESLQAVSFPSIVENQTNANGEVQELESEISQLSMQLMRNFEELSLIHELSCNLNIGADFETHCENALAKLAQCLPVATVAIIWDEPPLESARVSQKGNDGSLRVKSVVQSGQQVDEALLRMLHRELGPEPTAVRNHPLRCAPYLDRVARVILERTEGSKSYLIAIGQRPAEEYGTIEIQLMQSVAMILQSHLVVHQQFAEMRQMFDGTVRALVSAIDAKDPYTCGHSGRVSEMGAALAQDMGLTEKEVEVVRMSGLLHDIGKIGVSDAVLSKPGKLEPKEFDEIKKHPELGYHILKGIHQFKPMLPGVRYHHESWDGSGYPEGLAGEEIPLIARILAVADAFDAMTSTRPYRHGMPIGKVEAIFNEGRGSQWDPTVVDKLLANPGRMAEMIEGRVS